MKDTHWRQRSPIDSPGDNGKHENSEESRSGDVDAEELKISEVSLTQVENTTENTTFHTTNLELWCLTGCTEADKGHLITTYTTTTCSISSTKSTISTTTTTSSTATTHAVAITSPLQYYY